MVHPGDNQPDRQMRILLVEDNQDFQNLAIDVMGRNEALTLVGVGASGGESLACAQALTADMILLDLDSPAPNGLATIPDLRAALPEASIIGLSVAQDGAYRQAVLAAGVDELVCKTELACDLLPAMARVARGRRMARRASRPPLALLARAMEA
jgi:DNA-binding NarL/FixJ family response regulator